MHKSPAYTREGIPSSDVLYAVLPCYLHKRLFPGLEPVTFQSHNDNLHCAKAPPWNVKLTIIYQEKKTHPVENSNRFLVIYSATQQPVIYRRWHDEPYI